MNENVVAILELIEDSQFPAKRSISDYLVNLLRDLGVKDRTVDEIDEFFRVGYEKLDKQVKS